MKKKMELERKGGREVRRLRERKKMKKIRERDILRDREGED